MTKTVHIFDENTGEYLQDYEAQGSPREPGKFIEPNASTADPLPAAQPNKWPVRVGDAWQLVDDFRGEFWYDAAGAQIEVVDLGVPAGLTRVAPPPTKEALIIATKAEAQKRIIAIEANWNDANYVVQQLNALMGAVNFVFDIVERAGTNGGSVVLTQADKDTAASLKTKKSQIEAVRGASDLIEQDVIAGTITDKASVVASVRWPA